MINSIKLVLSRIAAILKTKADKSQVVQSDWAQTSLTDMSFIKNKPEMPKSTRLHYNPILGLPKLDPQYWLPKSGFDARLDRSNSIGTYITKVTSTSGYYVYTELLKPKVYKYRITGTGLGANSGFGIRLLDTVTNSYLSSSDPIIKNSTPEVTGSIDLTNVNLNTTRLCIAFNLTTGDARITSIDIWEDVPDSDHTYSEYEYSKIYPFIEYKPNAQDSVFLYESNNPATINLQTGKYSVNSYIITSPTGQVTFQNATVAPDGNILKGQGSTATVVMTPTQTILRISNI